MKYLFPFFLVLFMTTPGGYGQEILFHESFDDTALLARGWYDNHRIIISENEHAPKSNGSAEFRWKKGDTAPASGGTSRRLFTPSDSVYIDFWIKYSANYTGSDHPYHPHEFYLLTTEEDAYAGPAFTHLTAYVEQNEGIPQLALQDGMNIDLTKLKTDLTGITEDRAVCGCNGKRPEEAALLVDCYKVGSGYWNGKIWQAKQTYFQNTGGRFNQNEWHHITAFFKLNTIENGKGLPNGIVRYWYDGFLIIDNARVMLRTAKHPDMKFNQFLIGPWIGDGSPVDQSFWVDELTLSPGRIW
jgi:hypothetical protein